MFIQVEWVDEEPKHDYTSMWSFEEREYTPRRLVKFQVPIKISKDQFYLEQLDEFRKRMAKKGIVIK